MLVVAVFGHCSGLGEDHLLSSGFAIFLFVRIGRFPRQGHELFGVELVLTYLARERREIVVGLNT